MFSYLFFLLGLLLRRNTNIENVYRTLIVYQRKACQCPESTIFFGESHYHSSSTSTKLGYGGLTTLSLPFQLILRFSLVRERRKTILG